MTGIIDSEKAVFDFEAHKNKALAEYRKQRPLYEHFSNCIRSIIEKSLLASAIKYHSIESRAKDLEKFAEKASKPLPDEINRPMYNNPLKDITDLTGARIITFFPQIIDEVDKVIYNEFDVIEKTDKNDILEKEEKLGYLSIHYLVTLKKSRTNLVEYRTYKDLKAEIQVRTILQHAWAEIEHDIEYKSSITIPKNIKRRFMDLAGLLEIADREFQSIHNENQEIILQSRKSVDKGELDEVEITADSLKTYLDKKYGQDGRLGDFSYDYSARLLIKLGFENLKQVDECLKDYNDEQISKTLWGTKQGQLNRLEDVLLASLGDEYLIRHPWCTGIGGYSWKTFLRKRLDKLEKAGIPIGKYKFSPKP